jgi:hypothetical protein
VSTAQHTTNATMAELPGCLRGWNQWRPEEVDRFQEYRRNYHQFRRGAAFGAVGETSEIKEGAPGEGLVLARSRWAATRRRCAACRE